MQSLKKYLFTLLFIISAFLSRAQQIPQYTHFIQNYYALNPALAGMNSCLNIQTGYRSQWVGFDGAPKTTFVTISSPLKLKTHNTTETKHGIGAFIENDAIGPFSRSVVYLSYAYHFPMGRNITASMGVFGGLMQMGVDATRINLSQTDDPVINGSATAFFIPDFSPGIFINHDDWFVGYSIRQIFLNKWSKLIGSNLSRNRFHHYFLAGKRFKSKKFNIVPSGLIKFVGFSNPAIDLNLMFELSNYYKMGISWRNSDAIAGLLSIKFLKFFTFSYAYDFTTSAINTVSSNTHEFMLGISACPFNGVDTYLCPVFQ